MRRTKCVTVIAGALAAAVLAAPAQAALTVTGTQAGNTVAFSSNAAGATGFAWSFGDGETSTDPTPSHVYAGAGNYAVTVTATFPPDPTTTMPVTDTGTLNAQVVGVPTASFTYVALANGTVQFTDTSAGGPTAWQWTFPGGATSSDRNPAVAIPAGTNSVSLTASNAAGSSAPVTLPVTVNGPPVAAFTIISNPAGTNTPVTFNAGSSTDPNNDVLTYSWDLNGDQVYGDATGAIQTKSYPTAGTYRVGVRVTDGHGGTDTAVDFVAVLPDKAPTVSMSASPGTPRVGANVTFTATASDPDGTVSAIQWDLDNDGKFNDGTGSVVSWTFTTPGSRIVAVRATDDMGVATIAFQTINVTEPTTGSSATPPPRSAPSTSRRLPMLSPFPIVRIRGLILRGSVRVSLLSIAAPKGATVKVVCHGASCAKKKSIKRRVTSSKSSPLRFRTLERRLRKGTFIEVFISAPGRIGKYTSFTIRSTAAPLRRDRCLQPGHSKPVGCPVQ
jgi:PKD repeat protein